MFACLRKLGSRNTIATSDFRLEVEIRPFHACTIKNMQHSTYLWPNWRNFDILKEMRVEEHNDDVIFKSRVKIWPIRACAMHPP